MARSITVIPAKEPTMLVNGQQIELKKKVAAYCRVSTDQEEQLSSYENQVRYYTEIITRNPDYEMVDIYADEGISGTNTKKRDNFNRMIEDCRGGKIDPHYYKVNFQICKKYTGLPELCKRAEGPWNWYYISRRKISIQWMPKEKCFLRFFLPWHRTKAAAFPENCTWGIRRRFEQGEHK